MITSTVEEITPGRAADWLTSPRTAGPNRHLDMRMVHEYARSMRDGRWLMTGEAIKFGEDGRLKDGQHRLNAVVQAEQPVSMLVVRGVPNDAQDVMDTGRKRTVADALSIHLIRNATATAAVTRRLILIDRLGTLPMGNGGYNTGVTAPEVLTYLQSHPEVEEVANMVCANRQHCPCPLSSYLTALVLMYRVDAEQAAAFDAAFRSGAGLSAGNPIHTLRERLIQASLKRENLNSYVLVSALLRTWNAWRKGERLVRFPFYNNTGPIPMPDKLR